MTDTTTAYATNIGGLYITGKEVMSCVRSNTTDSELDV